MDKEPKKLDFSLKAPKGYENTLDKQEKKRDRRRELLNKYFNKIKKDPF
ncbi:hypothetical protein UFOVP20_31 [uncultured Caudovirales phage]|uniref:Uncharacterized protein n=1 Tax=uncultured Caudovirales phage TaxID=2100421 RepID=A0A6J5KKF8_9CAUD|nr:hypothetical protein UFOVP20_31 [uncultured Caudovirales phage]